jgi:hypothetical protein
LSVIFGGMSPLEMRSTYSADTFKGPTTASSVLVDAFDDLAEFALVLRGVGAGGQFAFHRRFLQQCRPR